MIKRFDKLCLFPVLLMAFAGAEALAAEWTVNAGVAPAVTYTDNVCLSADNERGEWVGLVTPDVSVTGNGNRANVTLGASVQLNTLTDSDLESRGCGSTQGFRDRDQFAPDMRATADAILVKDWLFIDANGSATQNSVSSFVSGGDDSLDRTGNTNTSYRYSVSPYIQRRLKDKADVTLRYTYDDQFNSKDLVGDSSQDSAEFVLASGTAFGRFSWGIQGNYSKVDFTNTQGRETRNSELKSAQINLGYQIDRTWEITAFAGDEWNDFVSNENDIDGKYWDVGFRWTPTRRTTVEAGHGDRFFGTSDRLSINHQHKHSVFTADYAKTLTFDRDIRSIGDPLSDGGEFGNDTLLSNSPVLDERYTLGYSYNGRRSTLQVRGSYSEQTRTGDRQLTNFQEATFKNVSVSVNRPLSRLLSVSADLLWDEQEPKGSNSGVFSNSETWRLNLGVQRQLNQNMALLFDYQYTDRQSDSDIQSGFLQDEYTENRFTLTLSISL